MTSTSSSTATARHLSTLTLHQMRYGELDGHSLAQARLHLDGCPQCSARMGVQLQERAAFVLRPMPQALREIAAAEQDAAEHNTADNHIGENTVSSWWRQLSALLGPLVAAAALFVAVPALRAPTGDAIPQDTVATRGSLPAIEAWVGQGDKLRPLHEGEHLGAGDRVQLAYDPQGASAVAIAGRDGSGLVEVYTTHAPTGIGLVRAPFALTLDDAPGVQELFVVRSDMPLDELGVKAALTTGVPGVRVARLVIHKASRAHLGEEHR